MCFSTIRKIPHRSAEFCPVGNDIGRRSAVKRSEAERTVPQRIEFPVFNTERFPDNECACIYGIDPLIGP